jgi:hypothetical protein
MLLESSMEKQEFEAQQLTSSKKQFEIFPPKESESLGK